MTKSIVQFSLLFVILVLAQAIVFNNICLFNVAVPFVFIYFIISLPITLSTNWVLTLSFIAGLSVDIFANTQGMNALACTLTAMIRRQVLHLYIPREDDLSSTEPSMRTIGTAAYIKYLFTMTLIYCTLISVIEAFTFFDIAGMVLRIACSTILSGLIMLGIDSLMSKRREKRL